MHPVVPVPIRISYSILGGNENVRAQEDDLE